MFSFFNSSNKIKASEFVKIMKDVKVLDVRNSSKITRQERAYFNDYVFIPLNQLPYRLEELDKNETYYIMCRSGQRSMSAAKYLNKAGIKNFVVVGGIVGVDQYVE